jgi:thiol-disulfide isomerase/thioredoxin
MSNEITIILVKADYCGHCKNFLPIFEHSVSLSKTHLPNVKFETIEMDPSIVSNPEINFRKKYNQELFDLVQGYPTILIKIIENNIEKYDEVNATRLENSIESAATKFIENIKLKIKELEQLEQRPVSKKEKQDGGNDQTNDLQYKNKYIKYKNKYLQLKNK